MHLCKKNKLPKKEYDLIFSLGEACSCTQAIRASSLQNYSYPFDWMFGNNFVGRCSILANKFNRFIDKNDLEYSYEGRSIKCTAYYNKYNELTFNHDFLTELPFDIAYNDVKEKYDRRINRLLSGIEKASAVLVVYIEIPNSKSCISSDDIIAGFKKIQEKYPNKKIDLLYVANDINLATVSIKKESISSNITKVVANYKDQSPDAVSWAVDGKVLKNILWQYKLKTSFSFRIKKVIKNVFIRLIPVKSIRKKLKKKYHL